ncbi:MAG: Formamidopyrimidine-DNA glycosylase [Parcubacteria group bacterium]|nr:Formamidopyrimidine-DNA glycosylase [Parcubacteria group bacterium]
MPELPEVQTTVDGLNKTVKGRKIIDVWTDYKSSHKMHSQSIKSPAYFKQFKKKIIGAKIVKAERRAKNILIKLSNNETILIHMKMTGHLMYGKYSYEKKGNTWKAADKGPLTDPFNQFLHVVFSLDKGQLAFSDMRKFAKVSFIETGRLEESLHLKNLGPEPLDAKFTYPLFKERLLKKPKGKIKQALMDQSVISGIGNIYSDEILWRANVHPLSVVRKIPEANLKLIFKATKVTLFKGIDFGGDSTSDYRNIFGERGQFQANHNAYQMHKKKCKKPGCPGVLERITVGGRSAHYCPVHQTLFS